jgi:hypothetical protein
MKKLLVLASLIAVIPCWAVPLPINYQGYLTRPDGTPLDTVVTVTIGLYQDVSGGAPVWTQVQNPCTVRTGLFAVSLGPIEVQDQSFRPDTCFLGVTVGDNSEMVPRSRILAVPFSLMVASLDGAEGGHVRGPVYIDRMLWADTIRCNTGIQFGDNTWQSSAWDTTSLSIRVNAKADSADNATRTWVLAQGFGSGGQQYPDTNVWDATRAWTNTQLALQQSYADTTSWDATRTFVTSQGYVTAAGSQQDADTNSWDATRAWTAGQLALKQVYTDTSSWDATRSWVNTQITPLQADADTMTWDATKTFVTSQGYVTAAGSQQDADTTTWDATRTFVTSQGYVTAAGSQQDADTMTWDATKSNLLAKQNNSDTTTWDATKSWVVAQGYTSGGQSYPDTNAWDATRTWVRSMGYLRGANNFVNTTGGFVGGGSYNFARGNYSVVAGGGYLTAADSNSASGNWAVVGGGRNNTSATDFATIGGGLGNTATDYAATVAGGEVNSAGSIRSTVAGGLGNSVTSAGQYAAILGGANNTASGRYSAVGGGAFNLASGDWSVIGGGGGGSDSNLAGGMWATIGGGGHNRADEDYSTVTGGRNNAAYGEGSMVGGGGYNAAYGDYSVISGGGGPLATQNNSASGSYSAIGGGRNNEATGAGGTVPGGLSCSANGTYSFAAGHQARAIHSGSFVWADGTANDYQSDGVNSFNVRAFGGVKMYTSAGGGAQLPSGASAWIAISDSTKKTDIRSVDTKSVLEKVANLPISEWRYKEQADPTIRHMGPMAQDFWKQFHLGEDSLGISTIDPDGISLAAIQALYKEVIELRARVQTLEAAQQQGIKKDK